MNDAESRPTVCPPYTRIGRSHVLLIALVFATWHAKVQLLRWSLRLLSYDRERQMTASHARRPGRRFG